MTVNDRIFMNLIKGAEEELEFHNMITDGESPCTSYYRQVEDDCASQIYNVSSPKEMAEYINKFIKNEDVANCITAKTFYDLYESEKSLKETDCKKEETEEHIIEIPMYTYTL